MEGDGEDVVEDEDAEDAGAAETWAGAATDNGGMLGHSCFAPCCLIQSSAVVAACCEPSGAKARLEAQLDVGQLGVPQPSLNCRTYALKS